MDFIIQNKTFFNNLALNCDVPNHGRNVFNWLCLHLNHQIPSGPPFLRMTHIYVTSQQWSDDCPCYTGPLAVWHMQDRTNYCHAMETLTFVCFGSQCIVQIDTFLPHYRNTEILVDLLSFYANVELLPKMFLFLWVCILKMWIPVLVVVWEKESCGTMTCVMNNLEVDSSVFSVFHPLWSTGLKALTY